MSMIRPRLDVVYGICRGLPSAHTICTSSSLFTTKNMGYIYEKGHQNTPQTPRILPRPLILKFLAPHLRVLAYFLC